MKVKVSYTVNLEEIPDKVKEIIKKNNKIIEQITELSEQILVGDLGAQSVQDLAKMKVLSEDLSERYSDCESILTGFLRAMFNNPQTEEKIEDDDKT